jgi:2-methylaconitate cis-trans-isomerase PrpF
VKSLNKTGKCLKEVHQTTETSVLPVCGSRNKKQIDGIFFASASTQSFVPKESS